MHPAFAGIGGHHRQKKRSDEWLTPPETVLNPLGGWEANDLDPASMLNQPWPTAQRHLTKIENGLTSPWSGEVWMNPPYGAALGRWMGRMAEHGRGIALIFARTETRAFFRFVWPAAHALLFIEGRLNFYKPSGQLALRDDGSAANAGGPSVLIAYGQHAMDRLAGAEIPGKFVPLIFPRYVLVERIVGTWREEVIQFFAARGAPARLDEIYRAFASHPKAQTNPHWRDKIRQVLQQAGVFAPLDRGVWEMRLEA